MQDSAELILCSWSSFVPDDPAQCYHSDATALNPGNSNTTRDSLSSFVKILFVASAVGASWARLSLGFLPIQERCRFFDVCLLRPAWLPACFPGVIPFKIAY